MTHEESGWDARLVQLRGFGVKAAILLVLWQAYVTAFQPSPIGFPSPHAVASAAWQIFERGFVDYTFLEHIWGSLKRLLPAYVLALLFGLPAGYLMAQAQFFRRMFMPFITLFRPLPSFAWLALIVVWLGFGEASKIAVVFVATATIITLGTMDAVVRVPPDYRDAAISMGARGRRLVTRVVLPAALPQILSSARVALTVGWGALIASELIAADAGIGVIIIQSARFIRTDQTFVGLILLAVIGGLTDRLMAALERRVVPWANR
jgi:taurine transport system permease protein